MAAVNPKKIKQLLDQTDLLRQVLEKAGEKGSDRLRRIKEQDIRREIEDAMGGQFDAANWSILEKDKQAELYKKLAMLRDSLYAAAGLDGPAAPDHYMHPEYASNYAIIGWAMIGFLLTSVSLSLITWHWDRATGTDLPRKVEVAVAALDELDEANAALAKTKVNWAKAQIESVTSNVEVAPNATAEPNATASPNDATEQAKKMKEELDAQVTIVNQAKRDVNSTAVEAIKAMRKGGTTERSVLMTVVLLGGLGGSLHFLRSLVTFIGTRKLMRSWLLYYLSMPFTGAVLAPIVYMLLRVGLITPSGTSTNGSAISNLNLIAIYAFSILSGLFARTALDKLHEVFKTLFRTQEPATGDKISSENPPGGTVTSP